MEFFVEKDSVVRKIWGKGDTILFIFGGAAAEFALNKAVDWLYFTGRLPADPLGRLFSTVLYARKIVFSDNKTALAAIDQITTIHGSVEKSRGAKIPDWAYRDVLYMLIHYSVASYELLEKKMSDLEKEDLYDVFYRMGTRMQLTGLPENYKEWLISRNEHLLADLQQSALSIDLFKQYRKHLGSVRYFLLIESQKLVVPTHVRKLLGFRKFSWATPLLIVYRFSRRIGLDGILKSIILPRKYKQEIKALDAEPV